MSLKSFSVFRKYELILYYLFQHGWIRATQNVSTRPASSVTQSPVNWLMIETQSSEPSASQKLTPSSPSKMTQNVSKLTVSSPLKSWKKFTSEEPSTPTKLSYEPRLKSVSACILFYHKIFRYYPVLFSARSLLPTHHLPQVPKRRFA